ncbi:SDR family NAD(P)-dependent oxidoreductase [Stakelama pacifica]|uniref:NADP-dependent 3-hydroxy acid dehydrogenase YdfG n=1 Tax=Stakelama pacifica TaxID=517720 RepID=A0A4R6FMR3_9SPHN|nr:SDR family NAD(P)-dependent oxidoreductase [Stakelama pacifica]TDN82813.1 NADP-dependent 3-hydroxy acid dehydrogenase YdfG [Stakelama pacifica]GGO95519.1 short-chain dehydrogenase/reductase [Stakelama pacifica]
MAIDERPVAVVVGAGPGNGGALAERFSKGGYQVALLARSNEKLEAMASQIAHSEAVACDVTDAASISRAFAHIRENMGLVEALLYNAGSGVFATVQRLSPDDFEASWRINAMGLLLCAQQVIPAMTDKGSGSIIITGATASLRGSQKTAAFAPAKAAERALAQSMAKSLWPLGIHVGLLIVDGVVDQPAVRSIMRDKPDDFFVSPDGLADTAWSLHRQVRQAWSFEVEVRPYGENW